MNSLIGDETAAEVKTTSRVVPEDFKGRKALAQERVFRELFMVSQDLLETRSENIRAIHRKTFRKRL